VSVREWAQGGRFGSILQAAPSEGCDTIVQQLLEAGADVNVQDGWHGNAPEVASYRGHVTYVEDL
jgi:ankyrin repeat domain-containing protein 50